MTQTAGGPRSCPSLSLVILAWPPSQRRSENVFTLLASLPAGLDWSDLEVVVVCNGNDPALASRLRAHERVDELLAPGVNLGVASGWNLGAASASGKVLCFVNEDVILGPSTLARTIEASSRHSVGLVGNEGGLWDMHRCAPLSARRARGAARDQAIYVPSGYYLAMRSELWKSVGGFDDKLSPAFYEEFDMAMRVANAGYSCGVIGDHDIYHVHGISKARRRTKIEWLGQAVSVGAVNRRNHKHVLAKWSPDRWRSHLLVFPLLRLWSIARWRTGRGVSAVVERLPWRRRKVVSYQRRMAVGVLSGMWGTLAGRAAGLVAVPFLVRALGLPLYGVLSIAGILVGSQGLIDLGVSSTATKFVAEAQATSDHCEAWRILRLALAAYTVVSVVFALIMVPLLNRIPRWLHLASSLYAPAKILLVGAVVLYALTNYAWVLSSVLQGLQRLEIVNTALAISQVPYLVVIILTVRYGWGAQGVIAALSCLYGAQILLMIPPLISGMPSGPGTGCRHGLRSFIRFGASLQFAQWAQFAAFQLPRVLAGIYLGAATAGRLDLALRLPIFAAGVAAPLFPTLIPAASRLSAQGRSGSLRELYTRATRYLGVAALPAFAVVLVAGPRILRWWIGPTTIGLSWPVRVLAAAFLINTITGIATQMLIGIGKPGVVARYNGFLLILSFIFLFSVRGTGGILGIAAAMGGAIAGSAFYVVYKAGRTFSASVAEHLYAALPSIASVAVAATVGVLIGRAVYAFARAGAFPVGLAMGALCYVVVLPVTGGVTAQEVDLVLGGHAGRLWERLYSRRLRLPMFHGTRTLPSSDDVSPR